MNALEASPVALLTRMGLLDPEQDRLSADLLDELEHETQRFSIASGIELVSQGETSHDLYVLISGRLGVMVESGEERRLVNFVESGAIVGEMALVSGAPRSATLTAFRDSELLQIPFSLGKRLLKESATFNALVIDQLVERVRNTTHRRESGHAIRAVALIALDRDVLKAGMVDGLARAFARLPLHAAIFDGPSEMASERPDQVLVQVASEPASEWSRRAVRQSDRTMFLVTAGTPPDAAIVAEIEAAKSLDRPVDLVIVYPEKTLKPSEGTRWLPHFKPHHILHARTGDHDDLCRIARMATGHAVGLVLSGGGARGFAHIGAIRALYEKGVPVDFICGTSMGALIGATAALDVDVEVVSRKIHHGAVANNPFGDYTLPILALSRGRRMSRLLRQAFGRDLIENCWKTFCCISSNLSTGRTQLHQTGPIWRALRASAAIPGVVPPVIDGRHVLVDGGVINNFPSDILQSFGRGKLIGVEVTARMEFLAGAQEVKRRSLFALFGARRGGTPNILNLLMRSGTIGSEVQSELNKGIVDLLICPKLDQIGLLSLDKFELAVNAGYSATFEALRAFEPSLWGESPGR